MDMICKCGGKEFFTEEHGNQTGLYCAACGKWQKWLKKDEIRLFNHGMIPSHDVAMQIEEFQNASLLERLKARGGTVINLTIPYAVKEDVEATARERWNRRSD